MKYTNTVLNGKLHIYASGCAVFLLFIAEASDSPMRIQRNFAIHTSKKSI